MTNQEYPFADTDLARRLGRTEARGNVQFVEARVKAFPDRGGAWTEVAGTYAMFDGVGSALTQNTGFGSLTLVQNGDRIFKIYRIYMIEQNLVNHENPEIMSKGL